jgi:hypothetical protein
LSWSIDCQGTALAVPSEVENQEMGFSPCHVETFPSFGFWPVKGRTAHVFRHDSLGWKQTHISDGQDG